MRITEAQLRKIVREELVESMGASGAVPESMLQELVVASREQGFDRTNVSAVENWVSRNEGLLGALKARNLKPADLVAAYGLWKEKGLAMGVESMRAASGMSMLLPLDVTSVATWVTSTDAGQRVAARLRRCGIVEPSEDPWSIAGILVGAYEKSVE